MISISYKYLWNIHWFLTCGELVLYATEKKNYLILDRVRLLYGSKRLRISVVNDRQESEHSEILVWLQIEVKTFR